MGDTLEKVTASGTHASGYGEPAPIEPDATLAPAPPLGFWRALRAPLIIFVVSAAVYSAFAWDRLKGPSDFNHFAYQAEAFLAGQVELLETPPNGNDWASYSEYTLNSGQVVRGVWYNRDQRKFLTLEGTLLIIEPEEIPPQHRRAGTEPRHYFVSFPPGPAVVMMPLVAIWGTQASDVLVTIFFGALAMALLYVLLRRLSRGGRSGRSPTENVWIVVVAGFGSVFLYSTVLGQVWYTALIIGFAFSVLHVLFAIDARRPFWAGVFLACAFATRTPLLFTGIVLPLFVLFPGGRLRRSGWGEAVVKLAQFAVVPTVVGLALMYMNWVRFGDPGEFGHRFLANGEIERIRDYGLFNYHFLARNLAAALTLLPRLQPDAPFIKVSEHGMSLFLTTPVLFYLFKARPRRFTQDLFWHRMCWAAVAVVAVPHLFYQNTGWVQFGYRFSIDYMPFLMLLLAIGRYPFTRVFKALVVAGIAVNVFGAVTFARMSQFYVGWFFDP